MFSSVHCTRTEEEEVSDGVYQCKFYIRLAEHLKFETLQALYKYHGKKPVEYTVPSEDTTGPHCPPGTKYKACLTTPIHSSSRAVSHSVSKPHPNSAPTRLNNGPDSVVRHVKSGFAVPFAVENTPRATHASGIQQGSLTVGGRGGVLSSRSSGRGGLRSLRGRGGGRGRGAPTPTLSAAKIPPPPTEADGSSDLTFGFDDSDDNQETPTDVVGIGNFAGESTTDRVDDVEVADDFGMAGFDTASDSHDDPDDDSSSVKAPHPSSAANYMPVSGYDDGTEVYAMVLPGRMYKVVCVGSARIPVDPGEQLLLSVITEHSTERVLVTSAGRPDIKSFMAEYLHEVEFEGDAMSFVNIERGARLTYKFAFENSSAANDFMQDLPAEIIERYSTFGGADDDEGAIAGTIGSADAGGGANAGSTAIQRQRSNISAYDNVRIEAAEVTGDDSHLRANRSEQLALETKTWAWR